MNFLLFSGDLKPRIDSPRQRIPSPLVPRSLHLDHPRMFRLLDHPPRRSHNLPPLIVRWLVLRQQDLAEIPRCTSRRRCWAGQEKEEMKLSQSKVMTFSNFLFTQSIFPNRIWLLINKVLNSLTQKTTDFLTFSHLKNQLTLFKCLKNR
jgi:hypothetical protein